MTARTRNAIIIALAVVVVCGLFVFGIIVGAAVIGYKAAMRAGNEAATIQNLRTIDMAEAQYFQTHNRTLASIDQLINEQLLSAKFRGHPPVADGYVFTLTLAPKPDGSSGYKITADPQSDDTGRNHYYVDSDDDHIRVNSDRQAGPSDPSL